MPCLLKNLNPLYKVCCLKLTGNLFISMVGLAGVSFVRIKLKYFLLQFMVEDFTANEKCNLFSGNLACHFGTEVHPLKNLLRLRHYARI